MYLALKSNNMQTLSSIKYCSSITREKTQWRQTCKQLDCFNKLSPWENNTRLTTLSGQPEQMSVNCFKQRLVTNIHISEHQEQPKLFSRKPNNKPLQFQTLVQTCQLKILHSLHQHHWFSVFLYTVNSSTCMKNKQMIRYAYHVTIPKLFLYIHTLAHMLYILMKTRCHLASWLLGRRQHIISQSHLNSVIEIGTATCYPR